VTSTNESVARFIPSKSNALDFYKLKGDPDNIGRHLADYINGFSENIRKIFERFEFDKEIDGPVADGALEGGHDGRILGRPAKQRDGCGSRRCARRMQAACQGS
jgi:hypothetical protein